MEILSQLPGAEKIAVGMSMSTRWSDPPMMLIAIIPYVLAMVGNSGFWGYVLWLAVAAEGKFPPVEELAVPLAGLVVPFVVSYILWNYVYHGWGDFGVSTTDYVVFHNSALERQYANRRIPMCELCEFYCDGDIDFNPDCEGGDVLEILSKHRDDFVNYKTTMRQVWWMISQMLPIGGGHGSGNSSRKDVASTTKEIKEHYDRGNAFFHAFLGDSMVYTSGVFKNMPKFGSALGYAKSAHNGELEQAQFNKMQLICEKLQLKKGERFLDIGCGWGSLTRHAVREYGAIGTGVTLSGEGKKYCDEASEAEGTKTETLCCDYRHIPADRKFEKIASIEMAEHVGLRSFVDPYLKSVRDRLTPGGMFLMQVAGLRQGANWQDVAWGLFMSRYIFPGADASTPLNWYIRQLELAGFEVHGVETIGRMYSHTLHKWYDNWMSHKDAILNGSIDAERETLTGSRLFRMWEFFLAYSVVASGQGSATCYQILAHPNTYDFPRDRWVHPDHVSYGHKTGSFDYKTSRPRSALAVFKKEDEADAASSEAKPATSTTPKGTRRRRGSSESSSPNRSSSGRRARK